MTGSIRNRVLLAAILALAAFLGLTGVALKRAFDSSAEIAVQDNLRAQLYGLLSAAELADDGSLVMPANLPEPRLNQPDSGLYGQVTDGVGRRVWASKSSLNDSIGQALSLATGDSSFGRTRSTEGKVQFSFHLATAWETEAGAMLPYQFAIAEDLSFHEQRLDAFRQTLWLWLTVGGALLLAIQFVVLLWGLSPLGVLADHVSEVERGERQELDASYPTELKPLATNLNALLRNERKIRLRYRNKLDDLAHSLKTPLSVLKNLPEDRADKRDVTREIGLQVARMQDIIAYQLRSSSGSPALFAAAHPIKEELDRVTRSLEKAYWEKPVQLDLELDEDASFRGDAGDLTEILGNLLDNAYKHCSRRVSVTVQAAPVLRITVEDDGPGIEQHERERILERGVRADTGTPTDWEGQGLGLAIVAEIVDSYQGNISIDRSSLGGALIELTFNSANSNAGST